MGTVGDPESASPRTVRATALTLVALGVCLAATAAVLGTPWLMFGVHHPTLHVVLDSVDACIALLVAYLLAGRYRRERTLRSLLLASGLVLLATANVGRSLVDSPARFTLEVWLPQSFRVLGAILVAAGALVASHRRLEWRRALGGLLAGAGVLAILVLVLSAWRTELPTALTSSPVSAARPNVAGHPALLVSHIVGACCFLVAAVRFSADASRREDEMLRWFAPACVLGAFSRLHYTLFPSIYSGWLYTGDLLRTGCYLLLLVGAAREISRYWQAQPQLAVVADRRRVARELHDGVVQELGFIGAAARGIEDTRLRERILAAAHRGHDEARAALEALAQGGEESLDLQLHRLAHQLGERYDARIVVDLDISIQVTPDQAHALVRIAREAVGNAVRHGGAGNVGIGLLRDETGPTLVVHDDGHGFDPESVRSSGYGITSMRDRAAGLPGELTIRSAAGRGTTVTVTWTAR